MRDTQAADDHKPLLVIGAGFVSYLLNLISIQKPTIYIYIYVVLVIDTVGAKGVQCLLKDDTMLRGAGNIGQHFKTQQEGKSGPSLPAPGEQHTGDKRACRICAAGNIWHRRLTPAHGSSTCGRVIRRSINRQYAPLPTAHGCHSTGMFLP